MTEAIVLSLPDDAAFGQALAGALGVEQAQVSWRHFPDGESHVTLPESLAGRQVVFNCTLAHPDSKLAPLLFVADAARDLGARQVGLVAPYLAYMRQDRRFHAGEAVTSRSFARVVSSAFDWLATVDPHLHRFASLNEIYSIPSQVVHAAPLLGRWIAENIDNPLILGPDAESEQWVSEVAAGIDAPYAVFTKTRLGDRHVRIDPPDLSRFAGRQPVLVDDIVSSGRTLIEAARHLDIAGFAKPICAVTHALFADDAHADLARSVALVVSSDTVPHPTNAISVVQELGVAVQSLQSSKSSSSMGGRDHA